MGFKRGATEVTVPPGRYIIGDPCYHVPDDQWERVLDESGLFNAQCWATFTTFDGRTGHVVAFSTAYGDGIYSDDEGRRYPVDAGLIGLIPLDDVNPQELNLSCANVIEFKTAVTCRERDGLIAFGSIGINTGDDLPEDEDDYNLDTKW